MDLADFTGYSLRRQLGSGPAGTVWQVRDRTTGRNAVLKQIPLNAVSDLRRLREDLSMLTRVRHPHIARVTKFRETETDLIVISQYVPAGTLASLLTRRGPLSRGELVTLLVPLAEAVAFLHRSHLTHGAITLHNVLLDADGRPVLTDATLHPAPPSADLNALTTLSHQAGADPTVFTPTLFTKSPPHHLLSLATPLPIDLAVPDPPTTSAPTLTTAARATTTTAPATTADTTAAVPPATPGVLPVTPANPPVPPGSTAGASEFVASAGDHGEPRHRDLTAAPIGAPDDQAAIRPLASAGPDLSALLSAPRPKTSDDTPGDDDPIALSRGPLSAPPPKPPTAPPPPPSRPDQSPTSTGASKPSRPRPRTRSRRGRTLRRVLPPPHNRTAIAACDLQHPPYDALTATAGRLLRRPPNEALTAAVGRILRRPSHGTLAAAVGRALRRLPYGTLVAVGLGAVVVLAVGVLTFRTLGAPSIAQAGPTHPQSTHPQAAQAACAGPQSPHPTCAQPPSIQPSLSGPQSTDPTGGQSQPTQVQPTPAHPTDPRSAGVQPTGVQSASSEQTATPARPTTARRTSPSLSSSPGQPKTHPAEGRPTGATGQPESSSAASADPVAWTRTLQALDAQRAQAFWTLDLGALDRIYVPGSSPWRADHALLSSYREQQIRVEGLRVQIDNSTIARRTPTTITLKTTDHLAAGQAVDRSGTKTPLPPGSPTTKLITLTTSPTTKTWRITAITQA